MVVFKITNNETNKNYIGTSFNDAFQRFEQYVDAAGEGLDFPLYEDIRTYGADAFSVEELFETNDKEELYELEQDYVAIYSGVSLRGYKIGQSTAKPVFTGFGSKAKFDANGVSTAEVPKKTTRKTTKKADTASAKAAASAIKKPSSLFGELIGEDRLDGPSSATFEDVKKPSTISRPSNKSKTAPSKASIQKMLREAEKSAKQEREEKLKSAQQDQAEEMALIMAKIDMTSKSATSAFRRRKS